MRYERFYEARRIIVDFLKKDLVGPVSENEIIEEYPTQYYSMGILFPKRTKFDVPEQADPFEKIDSKDTEVDSTGENESPDGYDEGISLSNMYNPSSLAVSTTVMSGIKEIRVRLKYARYMPLEETDAAPGAEAEQRLGQSSASRGTLWKRTARDRSYLMSLIESSGFSKTEVENGLELQVYVQKEFEDGSKTITVAVVNTNQQNASRRVNEINSFFQVELEVTATDRASSIFIEKRMNVELGEDPELRGLKMLYSHVGHYAVGHGCAVQAEYNDSGCFLVRSQVLPVYEIRQMKPSSHIGGKILQMKFLGEATKEALIDALKELPSSYQHWISVQEKLAGELLQRYPGSVQENINKCKEALSRIEKSITVLQSNDTAFRAFQLANRAMYLQRQSELRKRGLKPDPSTIAWYPFQLAFILQEIPSIVDAKDNYRDVVDLLWFPTGGGKTEAYLGLAAFAIFHRRLTQEPNGDGVTIIMRYTLRLLTIQQFERAAAMICACESLRKASNLGGTEISIGLFVGGGVTPNSLAKAEERLREMRGQVSVASDARANPCQLLRCPVCGAVLSPQCYEVTAAGMKIKCSNNVCEFSRGLPVYVVDEDIYRKRPTMIICTVDKFARMPWEPRIARLFGIGCNCPPPELIIQDELHLISGPLGTVAGLYETAIDCFCHNGSVGPKIVASTATIRNAGEQIKALFGRDSRQFPPQGINIRDSYFAEEASGEDRPTRLYVGVLSPSKTAATTLIRVYACLQFAARYLKDLGFEDDVIDNFWTITGYFNSLRELGGASMYVHDDVQDRYQYLWSKKFGELEPSFSGKSRYESVLELTSRRGQSEIARSLEELSLGYRSNKAFDYVLASNMISVGVDVGRLGLMAVTGQPKSNSEYIQASSRVGRRNPGLVVVVYNSARSRDRSHYEQFLHYHSAIYRYVEATSITPFSSRARERALHAVYVSMCRYLIEELRENENAVRFDADHPGLQHIEDFILKRAQLVTHDRRELEEVREDLQKIKIEWARRAAGGNLVYSSNAEDSDCLLCSAGNEIGAFPTLNSMRNVDATSYVYVEEE